MFWGAPGGGWQAAAGGNAVGGNGACCGSGRLALGAPVVVGPAPESGAAGGVFGDAVAGGAGAGGA